MRIRILSDLHLEFGTWRPSAVEADVVVLAGDIHQGQQARPWIEKYFPKTPVVYVLGNHEYYGQALPELTELFKRKSRGANFKALENSSVEIGGYRFLGCTLWTDFLIQGNQAIGMRNAEAAMADYLYIANNKEGRNLRAADTVSLHQESRLWLERELPRGDAKRTVVVTHHAPSARSEAAHHRASPLAPAFGSNLDELVERSGVPLWIHGHTHHNVDYRIGATRVLSNQRGYPDEAADRFNGELVVEI